MAFNDTTSEAPQQIEAFKKKNESQDETVIGIFQKVKKPMGASEVYKRYPIANVPITSIRRAISDLQCEGFLIDSGEKRKGLYGRNETVWILRG